jgi:iron complex outermembrane receptor protein
MKNVFGTGLRWVALGWLSAVCFVSFGQELKTVTVTASKYEEDVHEIPAYVTVITQKEIQASGASSINEVVMRLGGVMGRPSLYGGGEYALDLGGFGDTASSNMVIVIDGVPFKQGDGSEIRLSTIPIDQAHRIEIQRGASSVMYGDGAVAGVINIMTSATGLTNETRNAGSIAYTLGTHATKESRASARYQKNGWDLNYAGLDRSTEGFRQWSNGTDKSNSFSMQFRNESVRMGVNSLNNREYAQAPGGLTLTEFAQNRYQAQPASISNGTWNQSNSNSYGAYLESELAGHLIRFDVKQRTRDYDFLGVLFGAPLGAKFTTTNDVYGLNASNSQQIKWGKYSYILGYENNQWKQFRLYTTTDYVSLYSNADAFYFKNDLAILNTGWVVHAGYRNEMVDKNQTIYPPGVNFAPGIINNKAYLQAWELGASKALGSKDRFYTRFAQGYRMPNIDEMGGATWDAVKGMPMALAPQFSRDKEIGWKRVVGGKGRLGLRYVRSELSNEIIYDPQNFANINLDATVRHSFDLDFLYQVNPKWVYSGIYGVRESKFNQGQYLNKEVPMSPRQMLSLRMDWRFTPEQSLGASMNAVSSQQIAGDFSNENSMPGYVTVNARYAYAFKGGEFSLMVRNLFNADYYGYATNDFSSGARLTSVYPDQLRTAIMGIKLYF